MFKILLGGAAAVGIVAGGAAVAAPKPAQKAKVAMTEARTDVQARTQVVFGKLDTNHDGFITDADVEALSAKRTAKMEQRAEQRAKSFDPAKMFGRLDTNKDGKFTMAEAQAKIAARKAAKGKPASAASSGLTRLFARVDANKDGAITLAELTAAPRPEMPAVRKAAMKTGGGARFLGVADTNKDGKVSLAEMQAVAVQQFDRADANHDGKVTPEERKSERQALRAQRKPS